MASRPYTERFIESTALNVWNWYYVPAGYRAVVRGIHAFNYSPSGGTARVLVKNSVIYLKVFQGYDESHFSEARAVAYEGEAIGALPVGASMHIHVSGFLFRDTGETVQADTGFGDAPQIVGQDF